MIRGNSVKHSGCNGLRVNAAGEQLFELIAFDHFLFQDALGDVLEQPAVSQVGDQGSGRPIDLARRAKRPTAARVLCEAEAD